jgi:hypothetical protein
MTNNQQFLTINEAVSLTNKAPNTIRSLVSKWYQDSTKVVTKKKGKKFTYLINKEYLLEYFEIPTAYQDDTSQKVQLDTKVVPTAYQDDTNENITFLKEIIRSQQEEITKIHQLIENQQKISLHTQMLLDKNMIQLEAKIEANKTKERKKILWIF